MIHFEHKSDRLSQDLRKRILAGEFKAGSLLPTTLELAEEYGVAKATVTKAVTLLGKENLLTTRRGVGAVVCGASRMRTEANREIGLYLPDWHAGSAIPNDKTSDLWRMITSGIARSAAYSGYRLTFIPQLTESIGENLRRAGIANLIFDGGELPVFEDFLLSGIAGRYRYLMINRSVSFEEVNTLEEAGEEVLTAMFRQLIGLGYQRIAVVGIDEPTFYFTRPYDAYRKAMAGVRETSGQWIYRLPRYASMAACADAVFQMMQAPEKPQLLMIYRDRYLHGIMQALKAAKIQVPQDLKVVLVECKPGGVFEYEGVKLSGYALPSKREFGMASVYCLLHLIEHPELRKFRDSLPLTPVYGDTCPFPPGLPRLVHPQTILNDMAKYTERPLPPGNDEK